MLRAETRFPGERVLRVATLASLVALLGADWMRPLQGRSSVALLLGISASCALWAVLAARSGPKGPSLEVAHQRPTPRGSLLGLKVASIGLATGLLVAKWIVLLRSKGQEAAFVEPSQSYTLALALVLLFGFVSQSLRLTRFITNAAEHPARLMALSLGGAGLFGALLLTLPLSVRNVEHVSLVDSVFMAFSAVSVTGLAVNEVVETYTLFGQAVLLLLIQIGGLGIMVLSAAIAIMAGRRLRVKSSVVLTEMVDGASLSNLRRTVLMICAYTFCLEGLGAMLLFWQFQSHPDVETALGYPLTGHGKAAWAALFHSVSAFCNAGFSNLPGGLVLMRDEPVVLVVIGGLIFLGGIGFPVLDELGRRALQKALGRRLPNVSLHTRVTLRVSAVLLVGMAVAYLLLEWSSAFADLHPVERVGASLFHSVSARTAGFNVVDLSAMMPATLVLTCVAMFIGAAPGSAGGGIKVTTLAALIAGLRAELRASSAQLLDRSLPDAVIRKAIGVAFLSLVIVATAFFGLLLIESHAPLALLFEVVSAFSTTGLSVGVTPELSAPGKLLITFVMFIGRIGPLTLALAFSVKAVHGQVELPRERVMIG